MSSPAVHFIVGRDTFLEQLHNTLRDGQMVVVSGESGIGKTTAVCEYTQRFAREYATIVWINAASDEMLLGDILAALQAHALPGDMGQGVAVLFQRLYTYMGTQQSALLVLDNFAYNFMLQDAFTPPSALRTIIITRALQTPPEVPRLEVIGLDAESSAKLLLYEVGLPSIQEEGVRDEQWKIALELGRELQGLPIALVLAGRYIRLSKSSMQDYLSAFRDAPAPLQPLMDSNGRALENVAVVCERSLNYVQAIDKDAFAELQMSSLLLPEAIPAALFASQSESPGAQNGVGQEAQRRELLLQSSLLFATQNASFLLMHRLVQKSILLSLVEDQRQKYIVQILHRLHQMMPGIQEEPLSTRLCLAGQVQNLAMQSESESAFFDSLRSDVEAAETFAWAALLLWEAGLVIRAEPLLQRALRIYQHKVGDTHEVVASFLRLLATMNHQLKNYQKAEALAHRAIDSTTQALGIAHPDVLLALYQLGRIYAEQGKRKEARQCYEKVIDIGRRVRLPKHPVFSATLYDLFLMSKEQREWHEAESFLKHICISRNYAHSSQHVDNLDSIETWHNVADMAIRQERWSTASIAYRGVVRSSKSVFGEEHPVTLGYIEQAADILLQEEKIAQERHKGKEIAQAKSMLRDVQAVRERIGGEENNQLIPCLNGLARIARVEEEYSEGLALLQRAQRLYAQQAEANPLLQAALLDTEASIELAQQHVEHAVALYRRALELRMEVLGEKHLDLVEALSSLAMAYLAQKEYQQAEKYFLQALSRYQEAEIPDEMALDTALNGLAEIEIERGQVGKARGYLERVLALRERVLWKSDPRTVESKQKLESLASTWA